MGFSKYAFLQRCIWPTVMCNMCNLACATYCFCFCFCFWTQHRPSPSMSQARQCCSAYITLSRDTSSINIAQNQGSASPPRQQGLEVRNLAAKKRFHGPLLVAGQLHLCYPRTGQLDSFVRRLVAQQPEPARPFGWPHSVASNLNPPSPFSSSRPNPHPRPHLNHPHLSLW